MTVVHWAKPNALGDILAEAWRPGTAAPAAIHVRPEVAFRMVAQMTPSARATILEHGTVGHPNGILLVIDGTLPDYPGFEIHRAPPTTRRG
jgi:hypothetical protein